MFGDFLPKVLELRKTINSGKEKYTFSQPPLQVILKVLWVVYKLMLGKAHNLSSAKVMFYSLSFSKSHYGTNFRFR